MTVRTAAERAHVGSMAQELMADGFGKQAPHLWPALLEIICERHKQECQHGDRSIARLSDPFHALAVLVEEVGELATAMQKLGNSTFDSNAKDPDTLTGYVQAILENLRYEAIQVAACAVAIVEAVDGDHYP